MSKFLELKLLLEMLEFEFPIYFGIFEIILLLELLLILPSKLFIFL